MPIMPTPFKSNPFLFVLSTAQSTVRFCTGMVTDSLCTSLHSYLELMKDEFNVNLIYISLFYKHQYQSTQLTLCKKVTNYIS